MPSDIPVGAGQATFVFQNLNAPKRVVVTLGLDLSDVGGDYVAAADRAFLAWANSFLPIQSNNATLLHVDLFIGNDAASSGSVRSTEPAQDGGGTGDYEGPAVSALIDKQTGLLGRAGKGRMFVPYVLPDNSTNSGGSILSGRLATLQTAGDNLYSELTTAAPGASPAIPPVLLGKGIGSGPTKVATPITGFSPVSVVGVRPTRQR
jgi:hypothetical protein